jgi:serine/threonine-protein kinase
VGGAIGSSAVEFAVVVERAAGVRWVQTERLLSWLPKMVAPPHSLMARRATNLVIALLDVERPSPDIDSRLAFWCQRLGAGVLTLSEVDLGERANFQLQLKSCDFNRTDLTSATLASSIEELRAAMGIQRKPLPSSGPVLSLDLLDSAVTVGDDSLFLSSKWLLPLGDRVMLELKLPGPAGPVVQEGRVMYARTAGQARLGSPAGIELKLVSPPKRLSQVFQELASAKAAAPRSPAAPKLDKSDADAGGPPPGQQERRAAPRYRVRAPVTMPALPEPTVSLRYTTTDELAADYVANLSIGGAFIRTERSLPLRTPMRLRIELPSGEVLDVAATVVNVMPTGMGMQFQLTPETRAVLEAEIATLAAPRRALVVDDDAATLRKLQEELGSRGLTVVTAKQGTDAAHALLEYVPNFDVLVTELDLPEMSGEELLQLVRVDRANKDLIIIVYTSTSLRERALVHRFAVDAVVEKQPRGAERVAEAASRLLKERRTPRRQTRTGAHAVRFADAEAVVADADCLRMGGVFIKRDTPLTPGDELRVEVVFPGGEKFDTSAVVVATQEDGVGVQLALSPEQHVAWLNVVDHYARSEPPAAEKTLRRLLHDAPPPPERPNVRMGNYEILSRLGRGGMGEVFYAEAVAGPRAGQKVAIKRLLPTLVDDAEAVDLFAQEVDVLGMLQHPNIVQTYEVGAALGAYQLVMEAIDGRDLGQVIRKCRQKGILLPIDFAVYLAKVLLDALEYVHHAWGRNKQPLNLIHGDVTPSNLFISRTGEIKLGDFGVVQFCGTASRGVGKTHYLSPEAIDGAPVDVSFDLWAATVCLYELLTLERPFTGETQEEVFKRIRKRNYVPMRERRGEVADSLSAVVDRGFARNPKKRFSSAAEMGSALEPHFNPFIGNPLAIASVVRGLFEVSDQPGARPQG